MNSRSRILALAALILLAILAGPPGVNRTLRPAPSSDSREPIEVTMAWSGQPGLHRSVTLTVQITPLVQTDNLLLNWTLPAEVTLVGLTSESLGPAAAGQTITRQRDVTFDQAGTFKVAVGAQIESFDPPAVWADADVLFFTIRRGLGSKVSRRGPRLPSTRERIATPDVQFAASNHPNGGFTVHGYFQFLDIPTDGTPCPGTPVYVPARNVLVEVWESDTVGDDYEGGIRTNDDGYFSFWVSDNDDGPFGGDKEIYLEIYPNTPGGYVTDITLFDEDYLCVTGEYDGGQDIYFGLMQPTSFDPMFNIADALLDGWRYADQYRDAPDQVQALYEPGYGEEKTYYNPFWEEITLGDAGGSPDPYNDPIILHEYGHFIADNHSCDDSDGGPHSADKHYNDDLAWSEGWAHYLASAVEGSPIRNVLLANGTCSSRNWETWTVTGSNNEGAVVATLWDIHDPANETYDRLQVSGHHIWYTVDALMEDADSCDVGEFWDQWVGAGYPADSELAAIFGQHGTGGTTSALADRVERPVRPVSSRPTTAHTTADSPAYPPDGPNDRPEGAWPNYVFQGKVPWNTVLFLVDATNSMSGEISAVLQIIQDKINEMHAEPYPYEYAIRTFQDDGQYPLVEDHFFPDIVNPPVGQIVVGGGGDPAEDSFGALALASILHPGYDAWLFTDAAPRYVVSEARLEGLLQFREVTPYFFIFGDCSGGNALGTESFGENTPRLVPPGQLHLPRFAPSGLEDCIEPYLLVAGGTNGQFLFIDSSQIDDAAEIVRAFMGNNAGAGRYSDYVSSTWIYMWDDNTYEWYDAMATGTRHDIIEIEPVTLPASFSFYNVPYSTAYLAAAGYATFTDSSVDGSNTAIPTTALPNNAIYAFWDAISAFAGPPAEVEPLADRGVYTGIYTDYDATNDRFVIEYHEAYHIGNPGPEETFEIMLDYATDEIILQYAQVADDSSCTVGVENAAGTVATQVIHDNPGALYAGRAIKFTPMPPQPTRDHEVLVDSLMSNVIFLLNGYSGDVDLTIYDPEGNPIDPSDPQVTFLDVGKAKYYRVNLPAVGTWTAQASGDGTYYFTSATTGPLQLDFLGDFTLGSSVVNPIVVDLGISLTVQPSFSLVNLDGSLFAHLNLYDDGAHDDGAAGDGVYGGSFISILPGTFYLQVDGQNPSGEPFRRADLVPIRFQEMRLEPPASTERFALTGDTVVYTHTLYNDSARIRFFYLDVDSSRGWANSFLFPYLLSPNSSLDISLRVNVPLDADNVVEQTVLTARSGGMADNVVVSTIVRGPVATIDLQAYPKRIAPDGHQSRIVALVGDDEEWAVADGTEVTFQTTLGSVEPLTAVTIDGTVVTTLTSGAATGNAIVQATADGVTGVITVVISPAVANTLTLSAANNQLPPDGASTTLLTAQVYDKYGDPAPDGTQVVFSVEGDEMIMGSIEGQEVYTTTASGGVATATYRTGTTLGLAFVRAELVLGRSFGEGERVGRNRWARTSIQLGCQIFLPLVIK